MDVPTVLNFDGCHDIVKANSKPNEFYGKLHTEVLAVLLYLFIRSMFLLLLRLGVYPSC